MVKEDSSEDDAGSDSEDKDDYVKDNAFIGKGDGVICRRDKVGVVLRCVMLRLLCVFLL